MNDLNDQQDPLIGELIDEYVSIKEALDEKSASYKESITDQEERLAEINKQVSDAMISSGHMAGEVGERTLRGAQEAG